MERISARLLNLDIFLSFIPLGLRNGKKYIGN